MFEQLKDKRVLVTGHTGFKGSWLSIWLHSIGAKVFGYALAPETTPSLFDMAKVGSLCETCLAEVEDYDTLKSFFDSFKPEVVFHLAAQPLVRRSYRSPRETFHTNVGGTVNVLEAIRQTSSVKSAVIITTDKVYENKKWIWGYREHEALGGHDPYSASKGACEIVISSYIRSFFDVDSSRRIGVAPVRAGNVIGGGDFSEDRIIPDAVRAIQNNEALNVRSPKATRPWQYVLEPLGAYLLLACRLLEAPKEYASAWNIGPYNHDTATVEDIVALFYEAYGKGTFKDISGTQQNAPHEAQLLALCCDKAREQLGWQPQYMAKDATKLTATWYREVLEDKMDAQACCLNQIEDYTQILTTFFDRRVKK